MDEFGLDIPSADASNIKAPGQFETWDQSCRALTQVACFKGAKLQNTKPITPNFVVQHNVQLGESPQDPNASEHYSVMAQVFNETGVVMSTLHQNGVLEATVWSPALPFNKSMGAKMVFVMGPQQDMVWGDAEYTGDSFNTQARMGLNVMGWKGPMMQMSYTQTLNPRLSLGAEIVETRTNVNFITDTRSFIDRRTPEQIRERRPPHGYVVTTEQDPFPIFVSWTDIIAPDMTFEDPDNTPPIRLVGQPMTLNIGQAQPQSHSGQWAK